MTEPKRTPEYPHVETLRSFVEPATSWVMFEHGTVVITPADIAHPAGYARLRLREDAETVSGSATGDFSVSELPDRAGYVVSSHDPRVFTVVPHAEVSPSSNEVSIGVAGRAAHGADVAGGAVVYIEPR